MTRKWRGTALFAVIMAGVSVTVAGRLLTSGSSAGPVVTPQGGATDAAQPSTAPSSGAAGSTGAASAGGTSGATASAGATTTVTGDTEQTQYGPVQVSLTYSGSKITSVQVLQVPDQTGRDQEIASYATPQLRQEVVNSQSARVDTISGATYTSEGYLASVQSAIDKHK